MNSQTSNTPGLGLPPPGSEMEQLPLIHAPQTFHAPEGGLTRFAPTTPVAPQVSPVVPAVGQPVAAGAIAPAQPAPIQAVIPQISELQAQQAAEATQQDDTDSAFDEEWADKAREVVERTHADPYLQSKELGMLKAQYIKARYNKDIKVSED